jgi:hypothetical protein
MSTGELRAVGRKRWSGEHKPGIRPGQAGTAVLVPDLLQDLKHGMAFQQDGRKELVFLHGRIAYFGWVG